MTREEAERVAEKLVTTLNESFDHEGKHYHEWMVKVAGRATGDIGVPSPEEAERWAQDWREAIVRALMGDGS